MKTFRFRFLRDVLPHKPTYRTQDTMITYEEYNNKDNDKEEEVFGENIPMPMIVAMIVLFSLVGIFIVCSAIYGF